jgi:hypothetical protein
MALFAISVQTGRGNWARRDDAHCPTLAEFLARPEVVRFAKLAERFGDNWQVIEDDEVEANPVKVVYGPITNKK